MYQAARNLASQPADAEDLVHDTYVRAFAAFERARIETEADCRAWLSRIMLNIFRDQCRRRRRTPEVQTGEIVVPVAEEPGADPADRIQSRLFVAAVRRAINELPPEVKPVVVLFFAHQMSYKEIAVAVDCPVGTVMSRLYRGRRLLRESLSDRAPLGRKNAGDG